VDRMLRERLKAAYTSMAAVREARTLPEWKLDERRRFLDRLRRADARSLLEAGSGSGVDAAFFRENGLDVVCVDLCPEMVAVCRAKGFEAREMDLADLGFPDTSFDAVYALNSLLHVPKAELDGVLREVRRILAPGGLFYLGNYGGVDSEDIWEGDTYEPKRFFSFHTDNAMQDAVGKLFEISSFRTVDIAANDSGLHFQSLVLRRPIVDDDDTDGREKHGIQRTALDT